MIRILVISPYTKRLGIAVFDGPELIHFAVKTFRRPRKQAGMRADVKTITRELIAKFQPTVVISRSRSNHGRMSDTHDNVLKALETVTGAAGITTKSITFKSVKPKILNRRNTTKRQIFEVLAQSYPELERYAVIQNRHQDEYYTPLLTAVAIGYAYWKPRHGLSFIE